jgi:predicted transcriptional regulator YdeE
MSMYSTSIVLGVVLAIAWSARISMAADAPATRPAADDTKPVIGDMRVQTLQGYDYVYISSETTLATLSDTIDKLVPKVEAAMDAGQLRMVGPVIFTYHGANGDRNQKFTLDVGAMVKQGSIKPDGFEVVTVPQKQYATMLYTGSVASLGEAFGKLYGQIMAKGLQPTDVSREVYLYWESRESPNNILQLQVELGK